MVVRRSVHAGSCVQDPEVDDNVWDDSALVRAYDKAVRSYKKELRSG
jgi:hypothetical protein